MYRRLDHRLLRVPGFLPTLFICLAVTFATFQVAHSQTRTHGLSAFGDLNLSADFAHFPYVNPDAPKGGRLSMIGTAGLITYNSLNAYILKGDAAQGMKYIFDSLMVRNWDEPDAVYGLVAREAELAADKRSVTFYLRPEARFADGSQLTADDVAFSFEILKSKGHPSIRLNLRDVEAAKVLSPTEIKFSFTGDQVRDLPLLVAQLPIFSKAFYATREFDKTTLEPPLGSGPYKVGKFIQGRFITYEKREDYWAKDLPVNVGRHNFKELRYEYYRDRTAEFEALKSQAFDLREEFTSKVWATQYDIKAVRDKKLIRDTLSDDRPSGAQGFFINVRRDKFKDIRVRKALDLAFDFEWTNKNQFYGLYDRTHSFFENSQMKATGPIPDDEKALLEPLNAKLPASVFQAPYTPPKSNGSGQDRRLLRQASKLLGEAGWSLKDNKRVNAKGEILSIEFLIFSPTFERIITPFIKNLKLLGVPANIRRVDPAQYQERLKSFDFDITTQRYVMPNTPGAQLRNYWGSRAAEIRGSLNLAGISDPVVDELIEKVIGAKTRPEMFVAARALDRVLRAGHYWIPQWYKASHNVAYWDKFSRPAKKARYNRSIIETWWFDADKAAKLEAN